MAVSESHSGPANGKKKAAVVALDVDFELLEAHVVMWA